MSVSRTLLGAALLAGCGNAEKTVSVRNVAPAVSIQTPTSGSEWDEGEIITFQAIVGDDADDPTFLAVTWSSDVDGAYEDTSTVDGEGNVTWATSNISVGNHTITLQVVDSDGLAATDSIGLSVLEMDQLPYISMVHPVGDEYGLEGEDFEFVVQVSDEQDRFQELVIQLESDIDGVFCTPMADDVGVASCEAELSVTSGISDDHFLVFTVTDLDGNSRSTDPKIFAVASLLDSDEDGDGFTENEGDCDDTDSGQHPGADEVENGEDDDCDGTIDEGTNAYDDDGDGWSENEGDCDDTTVTITAADCDGDGYESPAYGGDDCDDTDDTVHPGAPEICDLADNDCNGIADDEGASGCDIFYRDADGDGYGGADAACYCGPTGDYSSTVNTDCYDGNVDAYPGASGWYSTHRGDGSYDWNCDGTQEEEYSAVGSCGAWFSCSTTVGWSGSVASCGTTASWLVDCDPDFLVCTTDLEPREQRCR